MKLILNGIGVCVALTFFGCSNARLEQFEAENLTMNEIFRLLPEYAAEHPGVRIATVEQLLTNHTGIVGDYPHQWDRRFRTYEKNAGFSKSVYEKYAVFPNEITNSRIEGKLLLMNACPFPGPRGEMQRILVAIAPDGFVRRTFPETTVQIIIHEAGIQEPKPPVMPPPPPAPADTEYKRPLLSVVRNTVTAFFESAGMSVSAAHMIWVGLLSLPFVALAVIGIVFWKRKRR